jgi:hypothetical protein
MGYYVDMLQDVLTAKVDQLLLIPWLKIVKLVYFGARALQ